MCGIAATIGHGRSARARELLAAIEHRGPDGTGVIELANATLVHARLAILDPTPDSDQPFRRGPLTLVYNGELYNHRELRRRLGDDGESFTTTGDTEVVAAALLQYGTDALALLEGMFALVVHDARDGSVLAARDRHGIKPLYWRSDGGSDVSICSEMTPLTVATGEGAAPRALRPDSVKEFLRFGAPVSAPIVDGIVELTPGTFTRWDGERVLQRRFATAIARPQDRILTGSPTAALQESIEAHAIADRPVAVFLSGGFDSTIVLAGLRAAGLRPLTLTLDTGHNTEDVARARRSAAHYDVEHVVVPTVDLDLGNALDEFLLAMDQPGIDGFNTFLISAACRRHDHPVAISGLGGDEVMGGYRYYHLEARLARLVPMARRLPATLLRRLVGPAARRVGTSDARLTELLASDDIAGRHQAFRSLFSAAEVEDLTGSSLQRSLKWHTDPTASPRRQLAQLDAATYLQPTLLRDADIYSMWHGVELRVPFVDTRVVDAILQSERPPTKLEMARAWDDPYLVEKAEEPKLTFRLPWDRWIGALLNDSRDLLSRPDPWRGHLDPAVGKRLLTEADGPLAEPLRPWSLLVLARWLERHHTAGTVRRPSAPTSTSDNGATRAPKEVRA